MKVKLLTGISYKNITIALSGDIIEVQRVNNPMYKYRFSYDNFNFGLLWYECEELKS